MSLHKLMVSTRGTFSVHIVWLKNIKYPLFIIGRNILKRVSKTKDYLGQEGAVCNLIIHLTLSVWMSNLKFDLKKSAYQA